MTWNWSVLWPRAIRTPDEGSLPVTNTPDVYAKGIADIYRADLKMLEQLEALMK
jgi:hypothetical protein